MFEKFKELLAEEMSINPDDISLDSSFVNDLGFNSLELADLVVLCEDTFDIEFDEEELPHLLTVKDVINYIENNK
ncbi:MAG: acyl carrier protein [Clostridia bacterium]|nr:acyl carrier protein [Clostridia bacterium]